LFNGIELISDARGTLSDSNAPLDSNAILPIVGLGVMLGSNPKYSYSCRNCDGRLPAVSIDFV
jgi:hypothetical protein